MDRVETVVIGAGVVGLAIARTLAASGREVVVIEREKTFGTGTSSRNSEVIHAGLYYPPGSLKARLCVEGAARLYAYCRERAVAHRRCGKLIVACEASEREALAPLAQTATRNGASPLQWLDRRHVAAIEPALRADAALLSENTGIVDSHALMRALLADAESRGATLAVDSDVIGAVARAGGFILRVAVAGEAELRIGVREVVNAAGLGAQSVAARIEGLPAETIPPLYLAKGSYFTLAQRAPFSHLIYPLPNEAGLGVHLTLDLGGQARFGPDVEWTSNIDYRVDPERRVAFEGQVRRYWPALPAGSLLPGYAGIRPKLVTAGEPTADFRIDGADRHGLGGYVGLYGIESPGLTASLAIAERVRAELDACR
jgi:L-2-hydroxyglutarate oxidase LhgO